MEKIMGSNDKRLKKIYEKKYLFMFLKHEDNSQDSKVKFISLFTFVLFVGMNDAHSKC